MDTNKKTEIKAPVKEAKPEIVIKDLVLTKDITVKEMKSCVAVTNAKGNKAYLKGHSLEISTVIPGLEDRTTYFKKNIIEKCHLGNSIGLIKNVADTKDLQNILKLFAKVEGIKKPAKEEKPVAKTAKKTVKTTKKVVKTETAKTEAPLTPAPEISVAA